MEARIDLGKSLMWKEERQSEGAAPPLLSRTLKLLCGEVGCMLLAYIDIFDSISIESDRKSSGGNYTAIP